HGRARADVVGVGGKLGQQVGVLGVAFHEPVARVVVVAAPHGPVLAVIVEADDLVPGLEQLGDEVTADEARCSGDEDLQSLIGPVMPQMSMISRPSSSSWR